MERFAGERRFQRHHQSSTRIPNFDAASTNAACRARSGDRAAGQHAGHPCRRRTHAADKWASVATSSASAGCRRPPARDVVASTAKTNAPSSAMTSTKDLVEEREQRTPRRVAPCRHQRSIHRTATPLGTAEKTNTDPCYPHFGLALVYRGSHPGSHVARGRRHPPLHNVAATLLQHSIVCGKLLRMNSKGAE
jgi:hypothetical protein